MRQAPWPRSHCCSEARAQHADRWPPRRASDAGRDLAQLDARVRSTGVRPAPLRLPSSSIETWADCGRARACESQLTLTLSRRCCEQHRRATEAEALGSEAYLLFYRRLHA